MNYWREFFKYTSLLIIIFVDAACSEPHDYNLDVDYKDNITLPCFNENPDINIIWTGPGKRSMTILHTGDLLLFNLKKEDSGEYKCISVVDDKILSKIQLRIKTPPSALINVTVIPSTVLALIRWVVKDDGGYSIINITIRYRQNNVDDVWHYINSHSMSTLSQVDIYKLNPNSTYVFEIWASNKLGAGERTSLIATTLHDSREIELARHLLQGAETFDTRAWLAAVAIVMTTLIVLTTVTCFVLCRDSQIPLRKYTEEDPERIELIPNVILNPGYYEDLMWSKCCPNETSEEDDDCTEYFANCQGAKAIRV